MAGNHLPGYHEQRPPRGTRGKLVGQADLEKWEAERVQAEAKRTVRAMDGRMREFKLTEIEYDMYIVADDALLTSADGRKYAKASFLHRNNVFYKEGLELHPNDRGLLDLSLWRGVAKEDGENRWCIAGAEGWIIWWSDCSEAHAWAVYNAVWQLLGGEDWDGKHEIPSRKSLSAGDEDDETGEDGTKDE